VGALRPVRGRGRIVSTFHRDYGEAFELARQEADRLALVMRLEAVSEYGRKGYQVSIAVQKPEQRYGRDARGEFIAPGTPKGTVAR